MLLRSDISMVEETGPESSEDYYHKLEIQCSEDSFWSQTSTHLPEQPARCQHCRHWIGQSDVGQHMQHLLNGCKTFLQQGRYDWRHDSVLNYVASCMKAGDPEGLRWHCDLPGHRTHDGGTVPDQLVQTELRPDICILDQRKERPSVILIEVTVTWDGRLNAARQEKNVKYAELMAKISRQFPVQFVSLEVGSYRQKLSESSCWSLKTLYNFTAQLVPFEVFEEKILRITELCSFKIFAERLNSHWDSNTPFPVPAAYIPPESSTPPPPNTDSDQNGVESSTSETDLNGTEPVYSTLDEEGSVSSLLSREYQDQDEIDFPELRDSPEPEFSGFSDPRFPEPKPSAIYSGPEPSVFTEPVPESKPDLVKIPAPATDQPEIKAPDPQTRSERKSSPQKKSKSSTVKSEEISSPPKSSAMQKIEKKNFPFVELFIFLLIFIFLVGLLFTIWTHLHIFMPILILIYAILKFWGKA